MDARLQELYEGYLLNYKRVGRNPIPWKSISICKDFSGRKQSAKEIMAEEEAFLEALWTDMGTGQSGQFQFLKLKERTWMPTLSLAYELLVSKTSEEIQEQAFDVLKGLADALFEEKDEKVAFLNAISVYFAYVFTLDHDDRYDSYGDSSTFITYHKYFVTLDSFYQCLRWVRPWVVLNMEHQFVYARDGEGHFSLPRDEKEVSALESLAAETGSFWAENLYDGLYDVAARALCMGLPRIRGGLLLDSLKEMYQQTNDPNLLFSDLGKIYIQLSFGRNKHRMMELRKQGQLGKAVPVCMDPKDLFSYSSFFKVLRIMSLHHYANDYLEENNKSESMEDLLNVIYYMAKEEEEKFVFYEKLEWGPEPGYDAFALSGWQKKPQFWAMEKLMKDDDTNMEHKKQIIQHKEFDQILEGIKKICQGNPDGPQKEEQKKIHMQQSFLVRVDPGAGLTMFLGRLMDVMVSEGYSNVSPENIKESKLQYLNFKDKCRLEDIEQIGRSTHFMQDYSIIALEIDDHGATSKLIRFLDQFSREIIEKEAIFVFALRYGDRATYEEVKRLLATRLGYVWAAYVEPLDDDKLWEFAQEFVKEYYPMELSGDLKDYVLGIANSQKRERCFYSLKSMEQICHQLVHDHVISGSEETIISLSSIGKDDAEYSSGFGSMVDFAVCGIPT